MRKKKKDITILVIGYGNVARLDDGLGPAFAARIQTLKLTDVTADSKSQLTVEDAVTIAQLDYVLFADASVNGPEPFELKALKVPHRGRLGFSTHNLSPAALLGLTRELFGSAPKAYLLQIRGHVFNDFGDKLSKRARANLDAAVEHLTPLLQTGFRHCLDHPPKNASPSLSESS